MRGEEVKEVKAAIGLAALTAEQNQGLPEELRVRTLELVSGLGLEA